MRLVPLLLLSLLPSFAVAAERTFVPVPAQGQSVRYERGNALLYAETSRAAMFLAMRQEGRKTGTLWIGIQNKSDGQFTIHESNVALATDAGPLRLHTHADRVAKVDRAARIRAVGVMLAAGASGYSAGTAGQSTQSGTVTGSAGTAYYSGTTNNPAAAQAAQQRANAQTGAMISQANALRDADKAELEGRALLAQSLDPGAAFTGDVLFDLPKAARGQPLNIYRVSERGRRASDGHVYRSCQLVALSLHLRKVQPFVRCPQNPQHLFSFWGAQTCPLCAISTSPSLFIESSNCSISATPVRM